MKFEQFDYVVSEHFIPAIINGDETGLSEEESLILEEFLTDACVYAKEYYLDATHHHCAVSESQGFGQCNISNLFSDCTGLSMMIAIGD